MRHEAERLEYFERRVANAQAARIGADAGITARSPSQAKHRAPSNARVSSPRLRMQMTGDFTHRTGRLVTERNGPIAPHERPPRRDRTAARGR